MKLTKRLVPAFILISVLVIALYFFNFSSADKVRISESDLSAAADVTDESIFVSTAKRSEMKKLASSGMLEMYLDEKTMAVCIYDTITGTLYRSLPEKYAGERPATLSLGVLIDGAEYNLSSQRDSLNLGCTEYEETDSGVIITYNFRQSLGKGKKLDISVSVTYTLSDGMLTAAVDCSEIYCGGKAVIHYLELLPFFGADEGNVKGDYILLPDGCGAVLDLSKKAEDFESVSLRVYGEDPAVKGQSGADVIVGAFGRKRGESAFLCLVSQGEALCEIKADKALEKSGYNRVGACFEITPSKVKDKYIYVSEKSYEGKAEVCYRFLGGENADYVGMASAARELLIRQGKLRENGIDKTREYPFNLTLIMSEESLNKQGKTEIKTLTTFNQAHELLASLKAKGFGNINVLLKGVFEKGKTKTEKTLGSKSEMKTMTSLSADGSIRFFAESSLFKDKGFTYAIDGEKLPYLPVKKITDTLSSFISQIRGLPFDGVGISDAGRSLFTDFSSGNVIFREDVKISLFDTLASLYASKSIITEKGNLYSIKYADNIISLPSQAYLSQREHFSAVPFIQSILHGIVDYSLEPANISQHKGDAMLKAAEYGALPHYEWSCVSQSENDKEDKLYYMNSVSEAKAYYDKMEGDFSDFRSRRITAHEMVKQDVYLTRFGEDCSVYVNYSDKAVSVGGVTVDAKSYALVN
ncbi:MAG: hypothetical protein IJW86_05540 [Clostridia bacterium]|nr:hypothetical protein [Clostridia bacterium]